MAKINLLPWREKLRVKRRQEFYAIMTVAGLAGVVLVGLVYMYLGGLQENQQARNQLLKTEIAVLDRQIAEIQDLEEKRSRMLERRREIERLQKSRSQIVHLFDELVRSIPEGVRLESLLQQGTRLTLEGYADSNAKVSAYMRSLDQSAWLTKPDLQIVSAIDDSEEQYEFALVVTVVNPEAQDGQFEGLEEEEGVQP